MLPSPVLTGEGAFCFSGSEPETTGKSRKRAGRMGIGRREYNSIPQPQNGAQGREMPNLGADRRNNYAREINTHNVQISKFVFYKMFSRDF